MKPLPAIALAALLVTQLPAAAQAPSPTRDQAMLRLARERGCLSCHGIAPGGRGADGLPPIGPAWQEVAAKYQGSKGGKARAEVEARLTQIVMAGSNPYDSHWKGKVSGLAMPPNAVAIQQAEARRLVKWILALPAPKP